MSEMKLEKAQEIVKEKTSFIDADMLEELVDAQDVVITDLEQQLKEARAAAVKCAEELQYWTGLHDNDEARKDNQFAAETLEKFGGE